jgi:hypothetical protein
MLLTTFCAVLAAAWLATTLTAFCPMRALKRRRAEREMDGE